MATPPAQHSSRRRWEPLGGRWSFDTEESQKATPWLPRPRRRPASPAIPSSSGRGHFDFDALLQRHRPLCPVPAEVASRSPGSAPSSRTLRVTPTCSPGRPLRRGPDASAGVRARAPARVRTLRGRDLHRASVHLSRPADRRAEHRTAGPARRRRAVLDGAEHNTPLASVEGFVRQVIGWREYMRATYLIFGRRMRTCKRLEHTPPRRRLVGRDDRTRLPSTRVDGCSHGYAHHIERLMVLGNAMRCCASTPTRSTRGSWRCSSTPTTG